MSCKNLVVAQSGGPTCAINASLAGVIKQGMLSDEIGIVYGALHGIQGIMDDHLIVLDDWFSSTNDFDLLKVTPAMALGSCRFRLPAFESNKEVYYQILEVLKKRNIGYFIYIGGNDSMDTAMKLNDFLIEQGEDIRVIGVPKTIDNDLAETDHCPGFGSAAKFVATTMLEIVRDCTVYHLDSVTIVEIMGRNAGWLTASAVLARESNRLAPQLIYLPEIEFDVDRFIEDVKEAKKHSKAVIVAVSEGVKVSDGRYVSELASVCKTDNFGHKYTAGAGKFLENLVADRIGCKVRSIELNVLQRCSAHLLSAVDIESAEEIGKHAVSAAVGGESGKMMTFVRKSSAPYLYDIGSCDLHQSANFEKKFPLDWILPSANDVSEEAIQYLRPLIQGEVQYPTCNGLPVHFEFSSNSDL